MVCFYSPPPTKMLILNEQKTTLPMETFSGQKRMCMQDLLSCAATNEELNMWVK
ncbi:unnamed protein product [Musa acuminata subsp. burmannicoides]